MSALACLSCANPEKRRHRSTCRASAEGSSARQLIGSSAIAIDLRRPIKNPSAPQIVEPRSEIDNAVDCDISSGCLPAAMPDDTLTQAPKQKRKQSAARKTGD